MPPNVVVQGVTGREARFWTERMVAYGTNVVAGVTPGKGGQDVDGIPVYDTVAQAAERHRADTTVLFVPPRAAKAAALEAIHAGLETVVVLTEHIPPHETMELLAEADAKDVTLFGPNSPGLAYSGRYFLGVLPAWEPSIFTPGPVGVPARPDRAHSTSLTSGSGKDTRTRKPQASSAADLTGTELGAIFGTTTWRQD